jgi:DNA adenine methylase
MSKKAKMVDLKGKYTSKYMSFSKRLRNPKICDRLNKIQASNMSYEKFIPMVDSKDSVLYLDPPYYGTESLYAFHNFGSEDHKRLADIMKSCHSKWLLSYYEFDDLSKWFPKDQYRWEYKEYKKASMATKGGKQSTGTEVLIINY